MKTGTKVAIGGGITLGLGALLCWALKGKAAPACPEGQTKCDGYDLYTCADGEWVLSEANSPECGYEPPAPECEEGTTKCVGYDLYTCAGGRWVLAKKNATECGYTPPPPPPPPPECQEGETKCIGYDLYVCQAGQWQLSKANATECGYTPPPECSEGQKKCVGYDRYVCQNGKWVLSEANSPECGYPLPPEDRAAGQVVDSWDEPNVVAWYQSFTVYATVRNVGGKAGTIWVALKHAPVGTNRWYSWHNKEIYLEPGQEGTVSATPRVNDGWKVQVFDAVISTAPERQHLQYYGPIDDTQRFPNALTVTGGIPKCPAEGRFTQVRVTPQVLYDRQYNTLTLSVDVQNIKPDCMGDCLIVLSEIPGLVGGRVLGSGTYWEPFEVRTFEQTWDNVWPTRGKGTYTGRVWVEHKRGEPVQDERTFTVEVV